MYKQFVIGIGGGTYCLGDNAYLYTFILGGVANE